MRYRQAVNYLFSLQKFGIKLGLDNITRLLGELGNPQASLNCIHVAGSNGKGSTCAFLQSIFIQAGYAAGMYTSPHLSDFAERIRINNTCIAKSAVGQLVADIRRICQKKSFSTITFFEFTTALAFLYFKQQGADPVIVETGMGGTYDATNCILPKLSVITSISPEHQLYLGTTIKAIASEKAGIIKPGIALVCGARHKTAQKLFEHTCRIAGSPLLILGKDFRARKSPGGFCFEAGGKVYISGLTTSLAGDHQLDNAAVAIAAADLMREQGYAVADGAVRAGIRTARWPGRLELLKSSPVVIADGAHNRQGWLVLKKHLTRHYAGRKHIFVLGVMQDKDIAAMLAILAQTAFAVILCRPEIERAAGYEMIKNFISFSEKKRVFWFENSFDAYAKACSIARINDLICITGSLFLVGELREKILKKSIQPSGRIAL